MSATILQINFKLNVSPEEYHQIVTPLGEAFNNVDGLIWKIWLLNPDEREAGGLYLFRDAAAVDAYLAGPIVAQLKAAPFVREISAKRFAVIDDLTALNHGPVRSEVTA